MHEPNINGQGRGTCTTLASPPALTPPSTAAEPVTQGVPDAREEPTIPVMTEALAEARQQTPRWHKKQQQRHKATPLTEPVEAGKCHAQILPGAAQARETKNVHDSATYQKTKERTAKFLKSKEGNGHLHSEAR